MVFRKIWENKKNYAGLFHFLAGLFSYFRLLRKCNKSWIFYIFLRKKKTSVPFIFLYFHISFGGILAKQINEIKNMEIIFINKINSNVANFASRQIANYFVIPIVLSIITGLWPFAGTKKHVVLHCLFYWDLLHLGYSINQWGCQYKKSWYCLKWPQFWNRQ